MEGMIMVIRRLLVGARAGSRNRSVDFAMGMIVGTPRTPHGLAVWVES